MTLLRVLVLFGLLSSSLGAEVEFIRVWPGYRTAESFVGIREYFGGDEPTGRRLVLRSQPDERSGYYWLTRVRSSSDVSDAVLEVQVVRPGQPDPEAYRFPVSLKPGSQPILVGLTGNDWSSPEARPTAWQVRLLDASGATLVTQQSFLWSAPVAPRAEPDAR